MTSTPTAALTMGMVPPLVNSVALPSGMMLVRKGCLLKNARNPTITKTAAPKASAISISG